ncbi:MAG TPA: transcriptional regulator [Gammaproteobacteria bacterium]|nr:transcriptional regulator [Gammaproteobacteria bacterium]
MIPLSLSMVLAAVLAAPALVAAATDDARQWLEDMSRASRSLNYKGVFVYQHDDRLEAMRIVHAMDDEGERERMFSLTGPKREVLRDNEVVTCILGDSRSVIVNRSQPRTPFPASFPRELQDLEKYYEFKVMGEDRVAGLGCRRVEVQPRDRYRYGRRLCVHDDSRLLLRSELTGSDGRAIERIMFTSVEFPPQIESRELLPQLDSADFSWKRESDQPQAAVGQSRSPRWEVTDVPAGFMLTDHNWHHLPAHQAGVEHWVYSDGLASVSVYIEKSPQPGDSYSGTSHRGALNAFGTMVDGYYVTVVGEVPLETVERIGRSVRIR